MPNSSEKKKSKSKNSAAVVSVLSENILESSSNDESEEEESQSSEVSVSKSSKPKTSIFGKGWNAFKQLFNGVPNVMVIVSYLSNYLFALINSSLKNPTKAVEGNDDSIDTESYEGITATETMEESEGTPSEPEQMEDLVDLQKDEEIEECDVNAYGWNRDEIIDCSKGNPLIMEDEMAAGMPFESMPPGLRIRVIGTTIDYILFEEKKGVGFITQEVIEELFKKFTGVLLNDACQTIDMTFKDFVDLHFSAAFKNCHPHGLARLEVVDKPLQSAFDKFCQAPSVAVTATPTMKAIEHLADNLPAASSSASSTQNVHSSNTVSQSTSSSSPIIQEEQTSNIQSPSNSSSQSYTTPVESDAELNSVEAAHRDVVEDEHEMLSTPVASAVPSRASLVEVKTETDEHIPDLEDDVLDYVTESAKEQKKKEAELKDKEVQPKAEEVKAGAKLKCGQHVNVLSPSCLFDKSDDEEDHETTPTKAEPKSDKFLQPTLLESDDEEKQATGKQPVSVEKENKIPAKAVSSNDEEVTDKKLNVKKDVKQKEILSAENKQLDYDLLDVSSEDENDAVASEDESDVERPKMDKKAAKKSQLTSTVDASLMEPQTSSQNATLLSKSLLSSTDSSDEEEPPKVSVNEEKKSTTSTVKKNFEVKSSKNIANASRLLESEVLCDSEEEEKNDLNTKKKKLTHAKSEERKSTKSVSKEQTYIIDHNVLLDESDEDNKKDNNQKQKDKKSDASTLPPNILHSGGSDESSDDEKQCSDSSSNKKVKSKPIELVKNIHLLDEKYMKPSDSESDSEQFVCIDSKEKEAKISADKKNEVFDIKNKPSLLSDSDEEGGENSAESEEVENSDVEGPSSLEASDIENDEPKHLEEDMFDILDKQIAEDFSKKSVENVAKAKEDEAKKTEEKLQNLAKKQAEYEKEGPTKSGVYRLENYLNNFIIDSEPAKIEELPKPEVKKSKSPVKVEQKPIIKEVEKPKEKSKSPASKGNVSKVVEAKKEESKPTAKVDPVKPKVAEAPKQPLKVSETKKNSEKPKSLVDENVKPAARNEVLMVEENFLGQVKTDENVAPKETVPILDVDNFLNEVSETSSNKAVPLLEDELLVSIDGNKSGVKENENAKPVSQKEVQMVEEDFLNRIGEVPSKRADPVKIVDDFLDQVSDCKSATLASVEAKIAKVKKEVCGLLNKITPTTYADLSIEMINKYVWRDEEILPTVVELIFNKAVEEPTYVGLYSDLCHALHKAEQTTEGNSSKPRFLGAIIRKCQRSFEITSLSRFQTTINEIEKELKEEEKKDEKDEKKIADLVDRLEDMKVKEKRRMLGTIRLISHLFRISMLSYKIIENCIVILIRNAENPDNDKEMMTEYAVELIKHVGPHLTRRKEEITKLDGYVSYLEKFKPRVSSRVKFMIIDLMELRDKKWVKKDSNPKTKKEVVADTAARNAPVSSLKKVKSNFDKPVAQKEVLMAEEDFLNQIGDSDVASKNAITLLDGEDFLNQVSESKSSADKASVMASDDFLNQVSGNKSFTNKAVSDVSVELLNQLYKINGEKPSNKTVSVVDEDIFLNQVSDNKVAATDYKRGYDKPVAQKEVQIIEEHFLNQIGDSNVASENAVSLLDGEDFLNQVSESKLSVKKAPVMASDDFLNQVSESKPSVKAAPIVEDDFLHHVSDSKSSAKKVPVIDSDDFLNDVSESKSSAKSVAVLDGDNFLDQVSESKTPYKNVPVMSDDNFLDEVSESKSSTKAAVPVIGDDFLDSLPDMKVTANKNVQLVGDDFLDSFDAKPPVAVVEEDFLEQIGGSNGITLAKDSYKSIDEKRVGKKDVKMVEDDFLNQIGGSNNTALKNAVHVLDGDDFLDHVSENHSSANKVVPVVGEDFLNQVSESKSSSQKIPVMALDDFLNEVSDSNPSAKKVPVIVDDNFLDAISENKSSAKATVPVIGDDFLASVSDNKSASKNAVPITGDKTPIPVVEEDFLAHVGGSNGINSGEFSSSSTKPSMIVPDTTMTKLINAAEIGVNYDSDSSDSSTPEVPTRVFTFLEYKLDQYLNVPNYAVVHEMKDRIAKSIPPPQVNHLLNFWLENGFPFSDFVLFFQYLYYHVERLGFVDTLSFKSYEHLVDAVVRREHIFHSRHELVSNIPLMCRYKFLIFDDNYPEYILINPELLKLQMYPLIGGLPTAVMYLFNVKRKWIISDLRKQFSDCFEAEFYRQLCNFLNDRPDLVMLQSPRPKATFPEMYIVLNDHISLKFCCYMFTLKDLNVAEKLHLRNDHIRSMKQFIPYR